MAASSGKSEPKQGKSTIPAGSSSQSGRHNGWCEPSGAEGGTFVKLGWERRQQRKKTGY